MVDFDAPSRIQCSTCVRLSMRLALKLFRGEPAISGFDWNFSAIHTSSPPFSTDVRSVLHCLLRQLQPDMGRSPGFGSAPTDYIRPIQTWFPFGSGPSVLNLASQHNSPDRSTKSTRFSLRCSTVCKHRVSGSLSLPSRGPFHLSFTVLIAIGH